MYLVMHLRGEAAFSNATRPLAMHSLMHPNPWGCIHQCMLTPEDALCIEFLTCEKSNAQYFFQNLYPNFFCQFRSQILMLLDDIFISYLGVVHKLCSHFYSNGYRQK